ncbi:MAG: heme ABC transporter permease CcmC [Rhodomicrobium sp.]
MSEPQPLSFWRISSLANPTGFMRLSGMLLPWLAVLTLVLFAVGLAMAFQTPPEVYQGQGDRVRIMFVHVPAAWLSMACYALIMISSAGYLIWRHPLADVSAKAAAPIGATFTLLALVTGSLWGKTAWNAYWEWDARLTSVLILFFFYLGVISLRQAIEEPGRAGRAAAILSFVGFPIFILIKLSVEKEFMEKIVGKGNWVETLHQPAGVVRGTVGPAFLWPLLVMAIAFTVLFVVLHMKAMRAEILKRRCDAMIAMHVRGNAGYTQATGAEASNV